MKKIIVRTALITLGITLIMAIAVFGIVSFCFPASMMEFTASLGMKNLSGDYAYLYFAGWGFLFCFVGSLVIGA